MLRRVRFTSSLAVAAVLAAASLAFASPRARPLRPDNDGGKPLMSVLKRARHEEFGADALRLQTLSNCCGGLGINRPTPADGPVGQQSAGNRHLCHAAGGAYLWDAKAKRAESRAPRDHRAARDAAVPATAALNLVYVAT